MHTLIVILGPTGVGKTELTICLAQQFQAPIINCDSRQIYREIPIGTAAPTPHQLAAAKHYFVGNLSITDYYSASKYETDVLKLIPTLPQISILSGGSMMYIDAVCNGIDDIPTVQDEIRNQLLTRYQTEGLDHLRQELRLLDPQYYATCDIKNPKRIIHALEICYQTGRTYTSFRTHTPKPRPFNTIKIGLDRPREELYQRINQRVLQMIEHGLENEARKLYQYRHLNPLNTVGYKEFFAYFDGAISHHQAIEKIQNNTRKYARKQLTWFRRDKQIKWFNPNNKHEILQHISSTIPCSL
ncbi:MAG: tRNA (adenosine(37)-N6)-dimethylallyltransferase MiaA [Bacteroidaceae bacterium]|nr:tRNA (adenosine(37)-N6)-dimethylallyltransferase MiaA [Bacteroidaceae bacterium]